jgi:diaminopropionate ammonia-lyase
VSVRHEATWVPHSPADGWAFQAPSTDAVSFHRSLPGYVPTPLLALPSLAEELRVGHLLAKDESARLGLPAFKALGASWAIHQALAAHESSAPITFVTASDGNHGRAVARFSRLLGHRARVVIPSGVHPEAVRAIEAEGAQVTLIDGPYDLAVQVAAEFAVTAPSTVLVQDTAWDGYAQVPGWIVEGYTTMFAEIDHQLAEQGLGEPDLIIVPTGVGALLQSSLAHYRAPGRAMRTRVISVESVAAACVAPSLAAGRPVTVDTGATIMAGLNCGTLSTLAWPYVEHGLDGAVEITDEQDIEAARDLSALGIEAGPCGASGLAGLRCVLAGPHCADPRQHLAIEPTSTVVMIITEGSAANPSLQDSVTAAS